MMLLVTLLAATSLVLTLVMHACVRVLVRRTAKRSYAPPPVTILKPLRGVDDDLFDNLASIAAQDHPCLQIVFGAEDATDPALQVAHRVKAAFPHVDIDIVAGAPPLGLNPKVRNLAAMARAARHGLWLVSDSNVRVAPHYLRDTVAAHGPDVGIVTNVFAGVDEQSLGALLENLQLCTWIAGGVAGSEVVARRACVVGKSMLFSRDLLQRLGGWASFADILAEDYVMGERAQQLGLRTVVAPHVIHTVNRRWSFQQFVNRHLRWSQIRRRVCPAAFVAEPLVQPTPWLLLLALCGSPWLALAGMAIKIASDLTLATSLRGRPFGPLAVVAIPIKDLLLAGLWTIGAFRRRVWWRGHDVWIGAGTVLSADPRHTGADKPSDLREFAGIAGS